jgi:electron transfer flavoprotein beta subunit
MTVVACLKWVDRRADADPLTGAVHTDVRTSGASAADAAALEWALRFGAARSEPVVAVSAGAAAADAVLHEAIAAGAAGAVRAELAPDRPSSEVAAALAVALRSVDAAPSLVLCGVWSVDRGSGSVPAFLAAELGYAQALGLVTLDVGAGPILAERRLDRGWRERVRVALPAVCSVEAASARLRRASLPGVLRGATCPVTVVPAGPPGPALGPAVIRPYRPRARELPAPVGAGPRERILALTGVLTDRDPPQTLVLEPPAAADALLAKLAAWGYR